MIALRCTAVGLARSRRRGRSTGRSGGSWRRSQATGPLVIFEDVHWGEAAFVELLPSLEIDPLSAPLFVVCLARPELFDERPGWDATFRLDPLGAADASRAGRRFAPRGDASRRPSAASSSRPG